MRKVLRMKHPSTMYLIFKQLQGFNSKSLLCPATRRSHKEMKGTNIPGIHANDVDGDDDDDEIAELPAQDNRVHNLCFTLFVHVLCVCVSFSAFVLFMQMCLLFLFIYFFLRCIAVCVLAYPLHKVYTRSDISMRKSICV